MIRVRLPVALLLAVLATACERSVELPEQGTPAYDRAVAGFHAGVAALQAGEAGLAETTFQETTELASGEPALWANLALTALARRKAEEAGAAVGRAQQLAPDHPRVRLIAALVAREAGQTEAAVQHLRASLDRDPDNLRALFLLSQLLERQGGEGMAEAERLMGRVLEFAPSNLVALLERARLAALRGAEPQVRAALRALEAEWGSLPAVGPGVAAARDALEAGRLEEVAREISRLDTALQRESAYRADRDALRIEAGGVEVVLSRFIRLPMPSARTSAPDLEVVFTPESLAVGVGPWDWVRGLWMGEEVPVALIVGSPRRLGVGASVDRLEMFAFPGGVAEGPLPASSMAFLDYDYNFSVDLAVAGPGGVRLLRQSGVGTFTDVTRSVLPEAASGAFAGVWAADLDMEGDMDLVLAREADDPLVLWNLGDERFEAGSALEGAGPVRAFAWADLDSDGDPDAIMIDAEGRVRIFANRRFRDPRFVPFRVPDLLGSARAVAVADLNRDAVLDLVLLQPDGTIRRGTYRDGSWEVEALASWPELPASSVERTQLFLSDLDNNGDLDLVASVPSATRTWLSTAAGMRPHEAVALHTTDVVDVTGEGRLDLVGLGVDGSPTMYVNDGARDYYSTTLRPQATRAVGDRRINSFGIGGEIEIRAGVLYQKQPITSPTLHFGMGEHAELDVVRIIWPNGTVQAEFGVPATNKAVTALQRLKGSCPWVFAWNGSEVEFVTDFLWRTALGLRINAQGDAGVIHAEDWIRIRGDQLEARDGAYDIRITGELWESHFFDHVSLLAVDHPTETEVFVDERFTLPAPEPAVHLMGALRPVAAAHDHSGRDVADRVRELDGRYVDGFDLGPYQGLAEEHFVEVDLGADATGPLWLVASGWVYPTDGSINFALAQAGRAGPRGLRIEVPDGEGGWSVVEEDYGFPAGKTKTILVDLRDAFRPGTERRVRLSTNMEVYWDRLAWAPADPGVEARTRRLASSSAELRYRGFSETRIPTRRDPETPIYDRIRAVTPIWRDLIGYHTRFGDVLPLLEAVDDRYVIMNAGDEMALRFPALPPPPDGWTRDFVLIGDGWVKDGDLNNGFSQTLMPLPYHGLEDYDRAPTRLEDDPAYRRHPEDWETYHTRYVTPEDFHTALVPGQERRPR